MGKSVTPGSDHGLNLLDKGGSERAYREQKLEGRLTRVEERSKSNCHRLDEVERRQDDLDKLVSSVSVLAAKQEQVESDVKEMKADVKTLIGKPARRWDAMADKILWAVLAAVIAFLLGQVGL